MKSDYPITVTVDKVENDEWDEDYTVIDKNGKIHYNAVTDDMLNFDETGAELTVSVTLTCLQSTKESEVTVLSAMHTYSRQERLDAAAKKGCRSANPAGRQHRSRPGDRTGKPAHRRRRLQLLRHCHRLDQ